MERYDAIVVGGGHNGLVAAGLPGQGGAADAGAASAGTWSAARRSPSSRSGPDYKVTSLSYVVSLLPPTLVRDLRPGPARLPRLPAGPVLRAPRATAATCSCPTTRSRAASRSPSSPPRDADADGALGRLAGRPGRRARAAAAPRSRPSSARSARPTCSTRPRLLLAAARASTPARRSTSPGCSPSSIADLVEEYFESDAMRRACSSVSGVIGTWAGPRCAGHRLRHGRTTTSATSATASSAAWGFPRGGMGGGHAARSPRPRARSAPRSAPTAPVGADPTSATAASPASSLESRRGARRADVVVTDRAPEDLLPRARSTAPSCPPTSSTDIERWKTRSGTVKVNLARRPAARVHRPARTSTPRSTAARSCSPSRSTTSRAPSRTRSPAGPRRCRSPTSASRRCSTDRSRPRATTSCRCSPSGCRTPGPTSRTTSELEAYADRVVARMEAVAPGFTDSILHRQVIGPLRDGARVRAGRRQHLPRRAVGRPAVPHPPGRRLRRPPHARSAASTRPGRPPTAAAASPASPAATSSARSPRTSAGPSGAASSASGSPSRPADLPREEVTGHGRPASAPCPHPLPRPGGASAGSGSGCCSGEWFCAGRADQVERPGSLAVVDVAGESVLLVRTRAGELRAHYNVCRHRGSQLVPCPPADPGGPQASPARKAGSLRCPYHSWTYRLEGDLLQGPLERRDRRLRPGGLRAPPGRGGHLGRVRVPPPDPGRGRAPGRPARPGARAAAPLPAGRRWSVGRRLDYQVAANWKLVAENYNECYHCAGVHPELCRLVPAFKRGGAGPGLGPGRARTARAPGPSPPPARATGRRSPAWTTTSAPATRASSSTPT